MKLKNVISCILLSICYSCIMDTKESWFIKNRTKDTLLITLSQVDTLPDWQLWNEDLWKIAQSDRSSREETAFRLI